MATLADWLNEPNSIDPLNNDTEMAVLNWNLILQDPTSVRFRAGSTILDPQNVRIESDSRVSIIASAAGIVPKRNIVIFGIRNHPYILDTDIQEGYIFNYLEDQYTVRDILLAEGEIQALAEANR